MQVGLLLTFALACPGLPPLRCAAELCNQVVRVCRALARSLPFRSLAATGGHKPRTQREALAAGVDVLVATPGRLQVGARGVLKG